MQLSPPTPVTLPTPSGWRTRLGFLRLVLLGTVLMLADALLAGVISLLSIFSFEGIGPSLDQGVLTFLSYLYIPAVLLGGVGTFLALYGIALGLRELLARPSPSATAFRTPEMQSHVIPPPPSVWWKKSPYEFAFVGAVLVLLAFAVNLTLISLRMLNVYPSPTATSFVGYFFVNATVSFVSGMVQIVGTILAYLGIAVALDRTTS